MTAYNVHTLDLGFQGQSRAIAAYLIKYSEGNVLVETGPGSTIPQLVKGLGEHGLRPSDITDVFLSHIHLDHAGAAGWFARQGAKIHVHIVGAPHMLNPEKLLASATRIYQDRMDVLWGEFLPVPGDKLVAHSDMDEIKIGDLAFQAIDTPGHAFHHFVYILDDICFSGDIGGVRIPGLPNVRVPMPPPEFNLELWYESLAKLRKLPIKRIAPTHFGVFQDPAWHLNALERALKDAEQFMLKVMPGKPSIEDLKLLLERQSAARAEQEDLSTSVVSSLELANPIWMSAAGIHRYWHKYRTNPSA